MTRKATAAATAAAPRRRVLQRASVLVAATVAVTLLALVYPVVARGPEFWSASFRGPWLLLGWLLVPLVFWRGTLGEDRRTPRLLLGTVTPLGAGPAGPRVWLRDLPGVVRAVALALLVGAMARPINTLSPQSADEEGIDAVLVLDLSGSMQAVIENLPPDLAHLMQARPRGMRPNRLDAAKAVIRDFISRRKTDRIGVVVFGRAAYVLSPPTLDYQLLDHLVSKMELGVVDEGRTAIGDAVGVAVARLRRSQAKSKTVILLTDGANNAGQLDPMYAAHLANSVGVRLYTIQIGDGRQVEVFQGFDGFGQPRYSQQYYPVNPELLRKLADQTNGQMYVATDAQSLEASFHDVLDRLEKTKFEANIATYEDLYRFLLLPGVLLLAADALLRSLVLRRFP